MWKWLRAINELAEVGKRKVDYEDTCYEALTTYKVRPEVAQAAINLAKITGHERTEGEAVAKAFRALSKVRRHNTAAVKAKARQNTQSRSKTTVSIWTQMRPRSSHGGQSFIKHVKKM